MFYVGQRVKKVRGINGIGVAGVVTELDYSGDSQWSMRVRTDTPMVRVCISDMTEAGLGCEGWTDPSLWEPITPPGLESIEEINALYAPDPVEARA